ncbi:4777_t:CDS:2, partial [Acaulospora colombiana]
SNPSSYDHPPPPLVRLAGPLPQKYRNRQTDQITSPELFQFVRLNVPTKIQRLRNTNLGSREVNFSHHHEPYGYIELLVFSIEVGLFTELAKRSRWPSMSSPSTRIAVFDNTYVGIKYWPADSIWSSEGNWTLDGNAINVYGTLVKDAIRSQTSYSIDGKTPGINNTPEEYDTNYGGNVLYNMVLFESPVLEYGHHVLNVTLDRFWTPQMLFVFDYVTIGVKGDVDADWTIVDDSDPSIEYSRNWLLEDDAKYEYKKTRTKTAVQGSTVSFKFSGTSIEVYGTFSGSAGDPTPIISFRVDDGTTGTFSLSDTQGKMMTNTKFYAQNGLSDGEHTLHIESLTATEFWLDYFRYKATLTGDSGSSSTPNSSSSSSKTSVAPIVGGVIGGFAGGLLLAFLIFLFYRRRKAAQGTPKTEEGRHDRSMGHTTFSKAPLVVSDVIYPYGSQLILHNSFQRAETLPPQQVTNDKLMLNSQQSPPLGSNPLRGPSSSVPVARNKQTRIPAQELHSPPRSHNPVRPRHSWLLFPKNVDCQLKPIIQRKPSRTSHPNTRLIRVPTHEEEHPLLLSIPTHEACPCEVVAALVVSRRIRSVNSLRVKAGYRYNL